MPSAVIGALRVDLDLNTAAFQAGAQRAERATQALGRQMQTIGQGMTRVGQGLTLGLTTPLVAFGVHATTAAIDAEEMQSAFNVSFGRMADDARRWATETGDAMGRATSEMQQGMLTMHGLFKAGGPATAQTRALAQQFAVLAQDLSSFHNVSPEDALARLRSGLSGEAEPLRRFNVYLTETAVAAEAARMGAHQVNGRFTEQAKILARANLILRGTTEAQGDVARTMGSTQNQLRQASSNWQEFSETVGRLVATVLPPLTRMLNQALAAFQRLSPETQRTIVVFAAVAAAVGPILMVLGPFVSLVGRLIPLFTGVAASGITMSGALAAISTAILPLAAAAAAVYLAWRNWDTIAPMLQNLWGWIQRTFGPPFQSLMATVGQVMADLSNGPFGALVRQTVAGLGQLGQVFNAVFGTIIPPLVRALGALLEGTFRVIGNGLNLIAAILTGDFSGAWNAAKALVTNVVSTIGNVFEGLLPGIGGVVRGIYNTVKQWLVDGMQTIATALRAGPLGQIEAGFRWLYDRVVGHSWVPDMVDGIAQHMARLDQEMAEPARRAARKTEQSMREASQRSVEAVRQMRDQLGGLLDRLFPEAAALRQLREEMALLDQAAKRFGMTADQVVEARRRLATENLPEDDMAERMAAMSRGEMPGITDTPWWEQGQRDLEEYSQRHMADIIQGFEAYQDGARNAGRAFADMASQAIGSIRSIADAFKSGDFLSMVQHIMDLVMSIQGIIRGPNASPAGATFKKAPGFARGGSFTVGGAPGHDANLVSMRLTKGEHVDITPRGAAPGGRPMYFDLRGAVMTEDLLNQMNSMADGAAARGAVGGLRLAERQRHRRARRTLGAG